MAQTLCSRGAAVCELHQNVVGGPDCAIMYSLQILQKHSYDLVILIENDVLLSDGWFEAMWGSIRQAQAAGFKVGAATVRVFDRRVLSFNDTYCLMLNSGAGLIALTPAAIDIVLENYRTVDGAEFIRHIRQLTGKDVSATVEFVPSQRLSVDFLFDLMLYLHGYVVAAPPLTFARVIDGVALLSIKPVTVLEHHLPEVYSLITQPDQIRAGQHPFSRFQKSPLSDRLLIGCHQLQLGLNLADGRGPVLLKGMWRRLWLQGLGPFGMTGSGKICVAVQEATIGLLLVCGNTDVALRLSRQLNKSAVLPDELKMEPNTLLEIPLSAENPSAQDIILEVTSGQVCLIGLTADAATVARYVNAHPSVDHLPL